MSTMGNITMAILRLCSHFAPAPPTDPEKYLEKAQKHNAKHRPHKLRDHKAFYSYYTLFGCKCILIRSKKAAARRNKAILYLHGGITNDWEAEVMVARSYANHTGMDVWYPLFPSITEAAAADIVEIIFNVYKHIIAKFGAANTALIGTSFGGTFGFGLITRINHAAEVEQPALYIANSPGGVPDTKKDWVVMEKMSVHDPLIPVSAVRKVIPVQELIAGDLKQYANSPAYGNFTDVPETYVYYAEETLAGNHKAYERAYQRYGNEDRLHLHIEPGMMHAYSCLPVFKESKEAYNEQIELLMEI